MGRKPFPKASIDRKNNNGDYKPSNCRWATEIEQARNTRRNRIITAMGKTQCLAAWAEETGLLADTIQARIDRGWTEERAVNTPVLKRWGKRMKAEANPEELVAPPSDSLL